jgi:hypothetical protein
MVRFGFRGSDDVDMKTRKTTLAIALVILGLVLIGCEQERISTINSDPGRFLHKDVIVAGTVTQAIGAFNHGIYQVDDGTGVIWAYSSSHGAPSKGARVGVRGRIMPTITFLGINYATVLQESERRG